MVPNTPMILLPTSETLMLSPFRISCTPPSLPSALPRPLAIPSAMLLPISHAFCEMLLILSPSALFSCWMRFCPKSSMNFWLSGARPLYSVDSTHWPMDFQSLLFTAEISVLKVPSTPLSASFFQPCTRPEKFLEEASSSVFATCSVPSAAMVFTSFTVRSAPSMMAV